MGLHGYGQGSGRTRNLRLSQSHGSHVFGSRINDVTVGERAGGVGSSQSRRKKGDSRWRAAVISAQAGERYSSRLFSDAERAERLYIPIERARRDRAVVAWVRVPHGLHQLSNRRQGRLAAADLRYDGTPIYHSQRLDRKEALGLLYVRRDRYGSFAPRVLEVL